ncbi:MAG: FCD domain-containing protein [Pseudonocardiaceae bacterium]|nr:FCD domain-containing protein [Pseudonocardiaceae bacterium]
MTEARAARARSGADEHLRPPMSKAAYVLERLRDEIAAGVVVAGSSLRQAEIAERYGVSATPVREALRLLEAEGTITYAPHRGATVRELSPTRTEDVYLLRAEIEGLGTAIAAERMADGDMAGINAVQAELEAAMRRGDGEELAVLNRRLHFTIYQAGSETIAAHAANLWALFPPHVTIWRDPSAARALMNDHEGILEALAARDPRLARERAAAHIFHAAELRKQL